MSLVQTIYALVILPVWVAVIYAAIRNPDLVSLATVVTPVMLVPVGYLFAKGIRDQLRRSTPDQQLDPAEPDAPAEET